MQQQPQFQYLIEQLCASTTGHNQVAALRKTRPTRHEDHEHRRASTCTPSATTGTTNATTSHREARQEPPQDPGEPAGIVARVASSRDPRRPPRRHGADATGVATRFGHFGPSAIAQPTDRRVESLAISRQQQRGCVRNASPHGTSSTRAQDLPLPPGRGGGNVRRSARRSRRLGRERVRPTGGVVHDRRGG